jgi:hypothetical protein
MATIMTDVEEAKTGTETSIDPKAFLARFGVDVDQEMEATIKHRLDAVSRGEVQASALHIDV